jgi:hypothetical protein
VECKSKCDTSNYTKNWNDDRIVQKIPEQPNRKARYERTTENSHIKHCTHISESTDVKVLYSIFNIGNTVICIMNSNCRIAATLFPTDMVCFRNISVETLHKNDRNNLREGGGGAKPLDTTRSTPNIESTPTFATPEHHKKETM